VRFTVTFIAQRAEEDVAGMLRSDFIGLGKVYQASDPRVLVLRPFSNMYDVARETLEELREVGALTFVEEFL